MFQVVQMLVIGAAAASHLTSSEYYQVSARNGARRTYYIEIREGLEGSKSSSRPRN